MEASGGTIVDLAHPDDLEQGIAQRWSSIVKRIIMKSHIE